MNKIEEALNNLYVNISLINNETIRDKSFEDLEVIRKELKALEIIKTKNVDIIELKMSLSVKQYNNAISFKISYKKEYELIQEEFDLLKEVLEDE